MPTSAFRCCSVAVDPAGGRGFEVEIALDAVGDAGSPECGEAFVDLAADFAELRIGSVAQGQHGEAGLVEARRIVGHQRSKKSTARCGGSPSPQVEATISRFSVAAAWASVKSAISTTFGANPSLAAALRA